MENQWIQTESDFKSGKPMLYGGIFTDRPSLIAQTIQRPFAPFIHHITFHNSNSRSKSLFFEEPHQNFDFDSSNSFKKINS